MTDYAKPTTAADALTVAAKEVREEAKAHRQEARYRTSMADECDRIASFLDSEAARYEKYQPVKQAKSSARPTSDTGETQ